MPLIVLIIYIWVIKENIIFIRKNEGIFIQNEYLLRLKKFEG